MFDWWINLPAWLRLIVALGLIILGALIFWFVSMRLGIIIAVIGFGFFVAGGKSSAEKKGYRF
jgi:hypothetical protein